MDVATKALLKVVRCNCKMGCDNLRCSCRKAGLDCSTGCGECRGICANMYENITEDNEYEEDAKLSCCAELYYVLVYHINPNNQMVK